MMQNRLSVIPGRRSCGEPGIQTPQRRDYGFRVSRIALARHDGRGVGA
jgi:hypothetical protein